MSQTLTRDRLKRYLGIGDDALRELLKAGLPATWLTGPPGVGRHVVFNREDVDEWIRAKGKADARKAREQAMTAEVEAGSAVPAAPTRSGRRGPKARKRVN
jgi:hypothetical protein